MIKETVNEVGPSGAEIALVAGRTIAVVVVVALVVWLLWASRRARRSRDD